MKSPPLVVSFLLLALAAPALAASSLPAVEDGGVPREPLAPSGEPVDDPREPVRDVASDIAEETDNRAVDQVSGLLGLLLGLSAWDLLFASPSTTQGTLQTPLGPVAEDKPLQPGLAGVAVVGLLALLGAWARKMGWLSGVPLFTRIQKDDLLKHEVRSQVFEYIRANPGANITELSRELGLAWGTVTHHLEKLRHGRLISMRRMNNQKCWFENGGQVHQAEMVALSALKRGTAARIAAFLVANPGVSQKELASALEMSRAAASFHVRKLAGHGVVERERAGKEMRLTLNAEAARSFAAQEPLFPVRAQPRAVVS